MRPYCQTLNPLNAQLNPICHLLALLGAYHILHVSRIRVKSQYLLGAPHSNTLCFANTNHLFLDVHVTVHP